MGAVMDNYCCGERSDSNYENQLQWADDTLAIPTKRGIAGFVDSMSLDTHSPQQDPTPAWQPFRGPFVRWPRSADTLLAFVALAITLSMWNSRGVTAEAVPIAKLAAVVLFFVSSLALIWRRGYPFNVHATIVLASVIAISANFLGGPIFAMSISLYSLGRYEDRDERSFLGVGAAMALLIVDRFIISSPDPGDATSVLLAFLVWYVGRRVRFRGEYLQLLEERAEQAEREQSAETEKAVNAERTSIARELHDIVAHQVSLMTIQASAAKVVAKKNPDAAQAAMASIEGAGRQALDELRHLMGVLRPDRDENDRIPQPGANDVPRLVEELKKAGLVVQLHLDPKLQSLPARVDLSVYRIVQEALTNIMKHAGMGALATVSIRSEKQCVHIEIEDDGTESVSLPGSGHGIVGMRERAEILGGTLEIGITAAGGFRVQAVLPIEGGIA